MSDYSELKKLAEAATPGPWSMCGEADGSEGFEIIQDIWNEHGTHTGKDVVVYEWSDESDPLGVINRKDAEFIAAANPAAVLALIAENDSSRKHWQNESNNVQALMVEVARLKAENAGLQTGYEAYEQVVQGLKAEVERHRAYADKCESAAAGFSRQLQAALIEIKALQGEKAAQGAIRKERQAEGIEKARAEGKYQGRPIDADLHARVIDLLQNGHGVRPTARLAKCSTTTVIRIKAALSNGEQS